MNDLAHVEEQVQAAQALLDPAALERRIRLLIADPTVTSLQISAQGVEPVRAAKPAPDEVKLAMSSAAEQAESRNQTDKMLKSGHYVRIAQEHGNVRITASGAVYVTDPTKKGNTWRRVKGQAADEIRERFKRK